jgi:hypothetical protein
MPDRAAQVPRRPRPSRASGLPPPDPEVIAELLSGDRPPVRAFRQQHRPEATRPIPCDSVSPIAPLRQLRSATARVQSACAHPTRCATLTQ